MHCEAPQKELLKNISRRAYFRNFTVLPSTLLPWDFIYAKLSNFTISKQGLMVKHFLFCCKHA